MRWAFGALLRPLLAAIDEEEKKIQEQGATYAAVRQKLDDALASAVEAFAYGRAGHQRRGGGGTIDCSVIPRGVRDAVAKIRAAIASLETDGQHFLLQRAAGDEDFQPVAA